jgi:Oxygenase domain of the 2OGFeDO superfamily
MFCLLKNLYLQRLQDDLYVSLALRTQDGANFLHAIANAETLLNAILALSATQLYQMGMEATNALKFDNWVHQWYENVYLWISVFSGIQVIVNRSTPPHRDTGAAGPMYDLLFSTGTHESAELRLGDVQANLGYLPGTVVLVCGRVLRHEVSAWDGGERICIAHYMRDNVHNRLGLPRPDWVNIKSYRELMGIGFTSRQRY